MRKSLVVGIFAVFGLMLSAVAGTSASATSEEFRLSLKADGIRVSSGDETLRYSPLWDGGTNEPAKVTLKQGDALLSENLTAEGDYAWSVSQDGTYELTHTTYTNGAVAKVLSAKFVVEGKTKTIDPSVVDPINPDPSDPYAPYSSYDTMVVYDGEGHTINTQALFAVTLPGATPNISFSLSENGPWQAEPFVYTNVGVYVCWYMMAAPNYNVFVHAAKVTIAKADNAWAVTPAIEGWTFGENAKTPIGAAKFGEVVFTYDPTTVGAAGDYTLTAAVDGTANYRGITNKVNFTIAKAEVKPGDDPAEVDPEVDPTDPEQRKDPEVKFSPWDYVGVYDGKGHLIDTNALVSAYAAVMVGETRAMYARGQDGQDAPAAGWSEVAPVFTNVCAETVWYKLENSNYEDVVHAAKVVITNRPITIKSGTKLDFVYDGQPHAFQSIAILENKFVAGEGIATSHWATVTNVGEVDNSFDFEALEGTKLDNYQLTVVTGKIGVVKAEVKPGDDPAEVDPEVDPTDPDQRKDPEAKFSPWDYVGVYDGKGHLIDTNALVEAYAAVIVGETRAMYARGQDGEGAPAAGWSEVAPVFTNVCAETVWYKLENSNYEDVVHAAKVVITNRPITIKSGTKLDFVYDGQPHAFQSIAILENQFVAGEGIATSNWATVTNVGEVDNSFDFAALKGTKLDNYQLMVVTGKIGVVKAEVKPDDDPAEVDPEVDPTDPEKRKDPEVKFSPWDYVGVYDGKGHLIDTNALVSAYAAVMAGETRAMYARGQDGQGAPTTGWIAAAPVFTNVCAEVVWYKLENSNYEEIVHAAKVVITNRQITITSGTKLDFVYDGQPHAFQSIAILENKFVAGEGIATSNWATVTNVGEVDNSFDFEALEGTKLDNYQLTVVTGKIGVVKAEVKPGDDPAEVDPEVDPTDPEQRKDPEVKFSPWDYVGVYDGKGHLIDTNALVSAYAAVMAGETRAMYARGQDGQGAPTMGWSEVAPVFTNVCAETVWYKLENSNYEDVVHAAKVVITNRQITITSSSASWVYDTAAHSTNGFSITMSSGALGDRALPGNDSIEVSGFPSITDVGSKPNSFDWAFGADTLADNYSVSCVTGKLGVVKADNAWTVTPAIEGWTFGENAKTPVGEAKFGEVEFTYEPATVGAAGDYVMTAAVDGTTNYRGITNKVNFTIAKANVPEEDDPAEVDPEVDPTDPEQRKDPEVKFSPWDYVGVYDGKGHLIDTNALVSAYAAVMAGETRAMYACGQDGQGAPTMGWSELAPVFTNVCAEVVWYKLENSNYEEIVHAAKVVITNRPITIKSGTKLDFVYDGQPHAFQSIAILENKFVAGEGIATSNWATVTNVGEVDNSFDFEALEGTKLDNYQLTVVTGKIGVVKAEVKPGDDPAEVDPEVDPTDPEQRKDPEVKFSPWDYVGVYDGKGHLIDTNALVEAYAAVMVGETRAMYARGQDGQGAPAAGWSEVAPVFTNVCAETVWYKLENSNYEEIVHAAKVVITNRQITITSASGTWTFDTTTHSSNWVEKVEGVESVEVERDGDKVVVGLIGDDSLAISGFQSITDVGSKPNSFDWAFGADTLADNYSVSCVTGTIAVAAREIGDDPANWDIRLDKDRMYSGSEQSAPLIQVAFRKPDGNLVDIPYTLDGDKATDAGNYTVKISGTGNYSGSVDKDWAIMPRNVTFTSATTNWVYDGTTQCASNVVVSGDEFVAGEGAVFSGFPEVKHVADAETAIDNAFEYDFAEGTKAKNYSVHTVVGKVKMSPRPVTVTSKDISKTYDGGPLTLTAADITAELPAGEEFTYEDMAELSEVGQIAATFAVADGTALVDDYIITPVYGTITVKKNATEITVKAKSQIWIYDGTEHSLNEYEATNLEVLLGTDRLVVEFDPESVVATPVDGPEGDGVVSNVICGVKVVRNGTIDVTKNYTLAWYPGALKVTKRPVTLTSKSDSKVYDGTELVAHEVTVGGEGFVDKDGATFAYTGSRTAKGTSENAFSYELNVGTKAEYYDITSVFGTLEVLAADISAGEDDDWEIAFGPSLTYTGLAQNQTLSSVKFKGLPLDYTVSGNQETDAGDYRMTIAGQGNFTGVYEVEWSIAAKALTLTAGGGSKVYDGTPLTVDAVTATGFVVNQGAQYVCEGSQLDVGESSNKVSEIVWNEGTKSSNYAVTKKEGALKVTKRPVTVTSKDISKTYDGGPLALTAADITASLPQGESFVYDDLAERTDPGQTSATFTIAAGPDTKLENYEITSVYGTITVIKPEEISVTAKSGSWIYDGEEHSLNEYEARNLDVLVDGDVLVVEFDPASVVKSAVDGVEHDGVVSNVIASAKVMRGTEDVTANYTVTAYAGALKVTKRPVTVTVTGKSADFIYDGQEHTVSGYDIATEDEFYDIAVATSFGGTASAKGTGASMYDMAIASEDFTNSDDNFSVTYKVTAGTLTIRPADIGSNDGADCVITLAANQKYNGVVQTVGIVGVTYKGLPVTYTMTGQDATHAGVYTLTVKGAGNFTGEKSTTWEILKRQVTLTSGSAEKVYDGLPLTKDGVVETGDGFIGIEGLAWSVTGLQTVAGTSPNTFTYELKVGTKSEDYEIVTNFGELKVTKAEVKPDDDPAEVDPEVDPTDPEQRKDPEVKFSPWDYVGVYDGKGHLIDTNALVEAYAAVMVGETRAMYARGQDGQGAPTMGWSEVAPVFTNVCAETVWYKLENSNYEEIVHAAKVMITNRPVIVTSRDISKEWDGAPLAVTAEDIMVSYNGVGSALPDGESFVYGDFASQTGVGSTEASFSIEAGLNTRLENYEITSVYGTITVTEPPVVNKVKVAFDALGGYIGIFPVVTQEMANAKYENLPTATRDGYFFGGWFDGVGSGAAKAAEGGSLLSDSDHTLFAKWTMDSSLIDVSIFKWTVTGQRTVRIDGFTSAFIKSGKKIGAMILPDMIDWRYVTEIAAEAFYNNTANGITSVTFPMFCTKIGDKAFGLCKQLKEVNFKSVRKWNSPCDPAEVTIGDFAFTTASELTTVTLCKEITHIGGSAFANCAKLASVVIFGKPVVGGAIFRGSSRDVHSGLVLHVSPECAADEAYMKALKAGCANVVIVTDAVLSGVQQSAMMTSSDRKLVMKLMVRKESDWGDVDTSAIRVNYRQSFDEPAVELVPTVSAPDASGEITLELDMPEGSSGFFQTIVK